MDWGYVTFSAGQQVEAQLGGLLPEYLAAVAPGVVIGPGDAPGTYAVRTDSIIYSLGKPHNAFDLTPDRLKPAP